MTSKVSSKIAKYAHDYRSRLLQEQGKTAAKMTKYDVALFMKKEGVLSESEFNSWVKEKEGQESLQLSTQQQEALRRGNIFNFVHGMQSYLDSDEVSDMTLGNVLGFERTTNEKTGVTSIKSKEVSKKKYSAAEEMKKQSFMTYIKSLPTPEATYTELMRSIEFDKLDNTGKMEMTLKIYGEKFNEAKKKGDKQAMKDYLLDGLGIAFQLACQKVDSAIYITQFKEWAKERSGLNFLVDLVDKYVDDGDDATLSFMEKNWEGIKGFGDALDSFIGTQAVAFIGALELAGAAAGTGAIGQAFNIATKGYFLYDGGKMMIEGGMGYYNAETKEDARLAGQEFGMGSVIFGGTLKSVIGEIKAYRASHAVPEGQGGLPELSEGHKAILDKNLPVSADRAQVSTDLAFLQQNGVEIVKFSPGHGINQTESSFVIKFNGKNYDITNDVFGQYEFKTAVSQIVQHIKGEAPKVWSEVDAVMKPAASDVIAAAEAKIATTEVADAGGIRKFATAKDAQGNVVKTTVKDGVVENNTYIDGGNTVSQTTVEGKVIGTYIHDGKTGTYVDARGNVITEQAFGEAVANAAREGYAKTYQKPVQSNPASYRERLETPDYTHTRENFPADAHQAQSKPGKATAYTTNGEPDGIVYRDADGKLKVPNKWDPEHPYEVSDGTNGEPASVIMIYDEAGGDFAVGDPTTIASTYKNPATGKLDPLYDVAPGRENAFGIEKDVVPSAYKIVEPGTEIVTKEGPRVVQEGEVVVYDTDGDPYVMPLKNFLKRQEPVGDSSQKVYSQLQSVQKGEAAMPSELVAKDGNATSPNAKTYVKPVETAKPKNLKFGKYDEARQEELVKYIWREDRGEGDYRVKGSDGYFSDAESAWAEADRLYPAKAPKTTSKPADSRPAALSPDDPYLAEKSVLLSREAIDLSKVESQTTTEIENFRVQGNRVKVIKDSDGKVISREPLEFGDLLLNETVMKDANGNVIKTVRTYPEGHPNAGKISEVETVKDGHRYLTEYNEEGIPESFRDYDETAGFMPNGTYKKFKFYNDAGLISRMRNTETAPDGTIKMVELDDYKLTTKTTSPDGLVTEVEINSLSWEKTTRTYSERDLRNYKSETVEATADEVKQVSDLITKENDATKQSFEKLITRKNSAEAKAESVSTEAYNNPSAAAPVKSNPASYRERLATPDYTHTRENFPADAHQAQSKPGKATAYTTNGEPDGIVYRDADGKLKVPNKWDPEHPYEVSDGTNGEPASVIMIYDEAGGDFAVGDPTTIASTYKNPATGKLDPLYDVPAGRENAFGIEKDVVPSAYKIVEPGTEIVTKEGPRVVQEGEVVVYDTDGDPYVMPLKNFLKRQEPVGDASQKVYSQLQAVQRGEAAMPSELVAKDGNATSPNAKTYVEPAKAKAVQTDAFTEPQTQKIISAVEARVAKGEMLTQDLINETMRETFIKPENPDMITVIKVMDDIKSNWSRMPEVYKNDIPKTLETIDDIYSRAKSTPELKDVTEKDVNALKQRIKQEPDLLAKTSAIDGQGSYRAVVQLLNEHSTAKASTQNTVVTGTEAKAEPVSFAQKANHVTQDGPQWLERRTTVFDSEVADMRTIKTLNPQTKDAVRVILDKNGKEIKREEVCGGDIISTREEFLDADGNVIKTNYYSSYDGKLYKEVRTEFNGDEKITHTKEYDSNDNVKEYYTRTNKGKDFTLVEYDANGNTVRKRSETNTYSKKIEVEISYDKNDKPRQEVVTVEFRDKTREVTKLNYEKGTKVIEKQNKDWNVTAISETGINEGAAFVTKNDIMSNSADVLKEFPGVQKALTEVNFDCISTRSIIKTLREKPTEVRAILNLKKPDGTPRFTEEEAAAIILNCERYLGTSKLENVIMTPDNNGNYRKPYYIWCIMVGK